MHITIEANTGSFIGRLIYGVKTCGLSSLPGKAARLIWHLWRQVRFKPYVVARQFASEEFLFQISDFWAEDWYIYASQEDEARWVRSQLKEGDLFVDCGSHHGMFTLLGSRAVGKTGTVIAIEAMPSNAAVVRKNLELNKITNVTVENVAMSDKLGVAHIEKRKFGLLNDSNGVLRERKHKDTVDVSCSTIDLLLQGRKPSLLKIDVEGHEVAVLRGAQQTLATRPSLDIEVHCGNWTNPQPRVEEIFTLISIEHYEGMIQLEPRTPLEPFVPLRHTPALIAQHGNVHLFLRPKRV